MWLQPELNRKKRSVQLFWISTFSPVASDMCIASAISLLMILICGMATYGAYKVKKHLFYSHNCISRVAVSLLILCSLINKLLCPKYLMLRSLFQLRPAWIIPFFCYQIFDFALNTLVAVSIVVYPNTIQDYLQQLVRNIWYMYIFILLIIYNLTWNENITAVFLIPPQPENFPYKEEVAALSNVCLVVIVLLFIGCILGFKVKFSAPSLHICLICLAAPRNVSWSADNIMQPCYTGCCLFT